MAAGSLPSPKELDNLSKEICDCWQSLGIQLGVGMARIDCIVNDNVQSPSPEKKAFAMLKSWYDKGSGSTYCVLSEALQNVGKARLAEKYCEASKSKDDSGYMCTAETDTSHDFEPLTETDIELLERAADYSPAISPLDVHVTKRRPRRYKAVATFGSRGPRKGQFQFPRGIAVNREGQVAVSDSDNHRVQIFSSDGQYLRKFGTKGTADGQFSCPAGLAYNKAGHIIVADELNSRIQVFSSTGRWISKFGQHVLKKPYGVSVTSDDNIVVCDDRENTVNVFSPQGVLLLQFYAGSSPLSAVFCEEKYYVSVASHVIKVFDSRGSNLDDIGAGHFMLPFDLAVDTDDLLLVCDSHTPRFRVFLHRKFATAIGSDGSGLRQLSSPCYIAVSPDGRVFVTEASNHRVQVFQAQC